MLQQHSNESKVSKQSCLPNAMSSFLGLQVVRLSVKEFEAFG